MKSQKKLSDQESERRRSNFAVYIKKWAEKLGMLNYRFTIDIGRCYDAYAQVWCDTDNHIVSVTVNPSTNECLYDRVALHEVLEVVLKNYLYNFDTEMKRFDHDLIFRIENLVMDTCISDEEEHHATYKE